MKRLFLFICIAIATGSYAQDCPAVHFVSKKTIEGLNGKTTIETFFVITKGDFFIWVSGDNKKSLYGGWLSLWSSGNGVDYVPAPGIDSFQIKPSDEQRHAWYVKNKEAGVKYYQARTRIGF